MASVTPLTSFDQFKAQIAKGDVITVIDFWATWCGPCKMISPVFEKLAGQYKGFEFFKVDVDDQEEIAAEVGIKAMPTFLFFKNGEKLGSVVGADPRKLTAAFDAHSAGIGGKLS